MALGNDVGADPGEHVRVYVGRELVVAERVVGAAIVPAEEAVERGLDEDGAVAPRAVRRAAGGAVPAERLRPDGAVRGTEVSTDAGVELLARPETAAREGRDEDGGRPRQQQQPHAERNHAQPS